jgi:hypothetical protein
MAQHSLPPEAPPRATGAVEDRWVAAAALITLGLYVALAFIQPDGEGFGRGWNLIAFLIYASPAALGAGLVALWRIARTAGSAKVVAAWTSAAGLAFPIVCIVAIRLKA